jgi:hypothetical protein
MRMIKTSLITVSLCLTSLSLVSLVTGSSWDYLQCSSNTECEDNYCGWGSLCVSTVLAGYRVCASRTTFTPCDGTERAGCAAGTTRTLNATIGLIKVYQCSDCPAGTTWWYGIDFRLSTCKPCVGESYSPPRSAGCRQCDMGSNASSDHSRCIPCSAGYVGPNYPGGGCVACVEGTYNNVTGTTAQIDWSAWDLSSTVLYPCPSCPAGSYALQGASVCTLCPRGKYQQASRANQCTSCDAGYYTSSTGATVCVACEVGTFQASTGGVNCTLCPLANNHGNRRVFR